GARCREADLAPLLDAQHGRPLVDADALREQHGAQAAQEGERVHAPAGGVAHGAARPGEAAPLRGRPLDRDPRAAQALDARVRELRGPRLGVDLDTAAACEARVDPVALDPRGDEVDTRARHVVDAARGLGVLGLDAGDPGEELAAVAP